MFDIESIKVIVKRTGLIALYTISSAFMTVHAEEAKEVRIVANEFSFSPATIEIKAGRRLQLTLDNHGALAHNITFKNKDVSTETIQGDKKTTISVSFSEPGKYKFFCSVPGHANAGMTGEVIVK